MWTRRVGFGEVRPLPLMQVVTGNQGQLLSGDYRELTPLLQPWAGVGWELWVVGDPGLTR